MAISTNKRKQGVSEIPFVRPARYGGTKQLYFGEVSLRGPMAGETKPSTSLPKVW